MTTYTDDDRTYASAEPCPYGMFEVRRPTPPVEFIPHPRRLKYQPYPWADAPVRLREEA